jgi:hypothetical protein
MRETILPLPPILQVHQAGELGVHVQASPLGPLLANELVEPDWLASFFAPHAVIAAALIAIADSGRPLACTRLLIAGNANLPSFAPIFRAPRTLTPMLGYWLGRGAPPWPSVTLLSPQMPWPGPHQQIPAVLCGNGDVHIGRLHEQGVLEGFDQVLLLPSLDWLSDLPSRAAPALAAAFIRGVRVDGICSTLTECWMLREYLRQYGLQISAPRPVHLQTCDPGEVVPRPAYYAWTLSALVPEARGIDRARCTRLHGWLQDSHDGYPDDGLWAGTPSPDGGYVYLFGGYCLSLEDGYVYAIPPDSNASPQRVAGPVPRVLHSHPPQHATEPVERWYWALDVLDANPPEDRA